MSETLRVAVAQTDCAAVPRLERIAALAERICRESGPALILFPELAAEGYDLSLGAQGLSAYWSDLALRLNVHLLAGVARQEDGQRYDSACCWDPTGRLLAEYRKIHLWGEEAACFQAGDTPMVLEIEGWKLGLLICADLGFPELSRKLCEAGDLDLLAVVSAWASPFGELWNLCCRMRAWENCCYLAAANLWGSRGEASFCGLSQIYGPGGQLLGRCADGENYLCLDLDKQAPAQCKAALPWLKMRRPQLY